MSVDIQSSRTPYRQGRGSRLVYDHAMQPAFTPRAGRHDEDAERGALHPLSRWVAVAALALVAVLFLLIVLQ